VIDVAARRWIFVAAMVAGAACSPADKGPEPASTAAADPPAEPAPEPTADPTDPSTACAEAPGWRYEPIALPPEFAPSLPAGEEILYFAPGMFDAGSPEYWSYVFAMRFETPGPTEAGAVQSLLDDYYRGLIAAVARSRSIEIDAGAIESAVEPGEGETHAATVALPDAFTTGEPITVHLEIHTPASGRCLRAAASASGDRSAPVWTALRRALACVPCAAP
jgi:hypothetical protein